MNLSKLKLPKLTKITIPSFGKLGGRQRSSIAIEIDEDICKVSALSLNKGSLEIPVLPFEFEITGDDEQIGKFLKEELNRRGLTNVNSANFSIPLSATLYKNIKLPKTSYKEIKDAVEWQIRDDIENLRTSTVFDYAVISEENNTINVLVVITKLSVIESIFTIAESAGITPNIIDSKGDSLINTVLLQKEKVEAYKEESNICVIHLDRNESYLIFYKENVVLQPLDFDIKRYESLTPDEKEQEIIKLIEEINYFFLTISEPKIIYISGYTPQYPEIKAYSQLRLGSRFILEDIDPVLALNLRYSSSFPFQIYASTLFLAYRGLYDD